MKSWATAGMQPPLPSEDPAPPLQQYMESFQSAPAHGPAILPARAQLWPPGLHGSVSWLRLPSQLAGVNQQDGIDKTFFLTYLEYFTGEKSPEIQHLILQAVLGD